MQCDELLLLKRDGGEEVIPIPERLESDIVTAISGYEQITLGRPVEFTFQKTIRGHADEIFWIREFPHGELALDYGQGISTVITDNPSGSIMEFDLFDLEEFSMTGRLLSLFRGYGLYILGYPLEGERDPTERVTNPDQNTLDVCFIADVILSIYDLGY